MGAMIKRAFTFGTALALGALALEWIDFRRMALVNAGALDVFLVAAAFLSLGVYLGLRVLAPAPPRTLDGDPATGTAAGAALGISARELDVLREIAAGHSNKEIARNLGVSPNTIKTHVAHLFGKLEARRRTDALAKARDLGLVP